MSADPNTPDPAAPITPAKQWLYSVEYQMHENVGGVKAIGYVAGDIKTALDKAQKARPDWEVTKLIKGQEVTL